MKILFIDTETGGLNPDKHSILTIALAVYDGKNIIELKEIAIQQREYVVTAKALEINNINLVEHDKSAISTKDAVNEIIQFIKANFLEEKPVIAGHNIEFDYKFIDKLFLSEREYLWKYVSHRKIDTCSLINYLMLTGKIQIESASLDSAIKYFNINTASRHTAKDDVIATIDLYKNINRIF